MKIAKVIIHVIVINIPNNSTQQQLYAKFNAWKLTIIHFVMQKVTNMAVNLRIGLMMYSYFLKKGSFPSSWALWNWLINFLIFFQSLEPIGTGNEKGMHEMHVITRSWSPARSQFIQIMLIYESKRHRKKCNFSQIASNSQADKLRKYNECGKGRSGD